VIRSRFRCFCSTRPPECVSPLIRSSRRIVMISAAKNWWTEQWLSNISTHLLPLQDLASRAAMVTFVLVVLIAAAVVGGVYVLAAH
jgi:hypothetical protein